MKDHLHKVNSSIAGIQDKYFGVIDNTIPMRSGSMSILNISTTTETPSFGTSSSMSANSKPMNNEQSLFLND